MGLNPKLTALVLLPLFLAGCATITNLTPGKQPRNAAGLYPVEVAWQSRQQSLRRETLKPYVVVGREFFPMEPTLLVSNRWETLIPIPAGKSLVNYRFKFDFQYNAIPAPRPDSKLSPSYQLQIQDK